MGELHKAYKYRIYPNKVQREHFERCFGATRFVFNHLLDRCKRNYDETKKHRVEGYAVLKEEHPWLCKIDSKFWCKQVRSYRRTTSCAYLGRSRNGMQTILKQKS